MKLLDKFKDKNYSAENRIYQFKNGVRLVYSYKPDIKDVDLDIIFLAGSYFEKQIGVPNGTTHFLEHMMMNPNAKFKTQKDIEEFTFGNSRKPTFYKNAANYKNFVKFYAYGHTKGLDR